ncbi:hypothetical protein Intca_2487 [Intrasporangium calvum DSM 43043]|uniref:DUF4870 domain-containing protein n=2 Tax=Intrasporangium calvum TaxID=53358 RepID=E6S760_INTC7|nr:hypothetical protein Intca_2487 [Intrasporangium calvum DSM 43043]
MVRRHALAQTGRMTYPYRPDPTRDAVAVTDDERTWAVLGHISTLVAAVLSVGWLSFLGPLVIWAVHKDRSAFVRQSAAGAFNFNLVIWATTIVGWIFFITLIGIPVAIILWVAAFATSVYCHVRGAVLASRGEQYRYPWGLTVLR